MLTHLTQAANYKWWAFIAIASGTFVSVVDHGTVLVALPTITDHFNSDLPTAQWVVVGYALTISALLLPMGRLSDIIGRKRIYVYGFVIYIIGAALSGFAGEMLPLILFKVIQGAGSAMVQGTGMAMITSIFPANERGKALGLHMSVVGVGAVAGPVLGGLLVETLGWQWVFFINVPAGLMVITAVLVILDPSRLGQEGGRAKFDWLGAGLSAGLLVAFLLFLTTGPTSGWGSPGVLAGMAAFVVLFASFIWWELHTQSPMLDLSLFKRRVFALGVLTGWISFLSNSPVRFLIPFFLQPVLGFSPAQMGLLLAPGALAMIIMGPLSGRLSDRYGWRKLNVGGNLVSASGLILLSTVTVNTPVALVVASFVFSSMGMGMFNSPNSSSIFSAVEREKFGVVGALTQLMRNSANVTSIAIATAIVTATMASMGFPPSLEACSDAAGDPGVCTAFTAGMRRAGLAFGILLLAGAVLSYLKGERPRPVVEPPRPVAQAEPAQPD